MEDKLEVHEDIKMTQNNSNAAPKEVELKKSSATNRFSRERSKLSEALNSRANTMLRAANFSRESNATRPQTSTIAAMVGSLEKEKTVLETTLEEDEEMQLFLMDMKKHQQDKIKEFTDSDFDTDLEDEIVAKTGTPSSWDERKLYRKTCKKLGIRPVPEIERTLHKGHNITVKNRSMNALDMLALANALISNQKITHLRLDDNKLGDEGAICVVWLLTEQESFLENVSLADNNIRNDGFKALGEMLEQNKLIKSLNLSGNKGQDKNIAELAKALTTNNRLRLLNLSHNNIGDIGATILAPAIAANDGLHTLDLSWNKIRPKGATAIVSALKENIILKSLNLQMNGLSTAGATVMGDVLKNNETLTYLNLSYNRIFDKGCAYIAKGLEKNERLHHLIEVWLYLALYDWVDLKLHDNPITASGAYALLGAIAKNKNTAMWKLDLQTIHVVKKCTEFADEISYNTGGDFVLRHAGLVDSEVNTVVATESKLDSRNPMAVVKNYVEERGLRMIDFFKQMDTDHSGSISREEFVDGLALANVPLSLAQIDNLIEMLDKDGDGEIDYNELIEGEREYKRGLLKKRMDEMKIIEQHLATQKTIIKEKTKLQSESSKLLQ